MNKHKLRAKLPVALRHCIPHTPHESVLVKGKKKEKLLAILAVMGGTKKPNYNAIYLHGRRVTHDTRRQGALHVNVRVLVEATNIYTSLTASSAH